MPEVVLRTRGLRAIGTYTFHFVPFCTILKMLRLERGIIYII